MTSARPDGNGGLYIHRSTVEKALWAVCIVVLGAFLSFFGLVAQRTYDTLQRLDKGLDRTAAALIETNSKLQIVAVQSSETTARVSELQLTVAAKK